MGVIMSEQNKKAYGVKRLESKTARAAIIQKITEDFNLMPIIAEAYYKQISSYFDQHANVQLTSGQICYEAVAADEPAGRHIVLTRKVSCRLTLNDVNTDFEVLVNYGLAGLRRHRILRLTREAYDQGALLSYEDLAILLTASPATMKRDIRHLRHDGKFVMTRGVKHDMGPGLSHKTQIIELYLKGYQSEKSVLHYLSQFTRVITLHQQGFPPPQIRMITKMSDRLVKEYLQLLSEYQDSDRLSQLVKPLVSTTEDTTEKRGQSQ
jgi:hypothetical protein